MRKRDPTPVGPAVSRLIWLTDCVHSGQRSKSDRICQIRSQDAAIWILFRNSRIMISRDMSVANHFAGGPLRSGDRSYKEQAIDTEEDAAQKNLSGVDWIADLAVACLLNPAAPTVPTNLSTHQDRMARTWLGGRTSTTAHSGSSPSLPVLRDLGVLATYLPADCTQFRNVLTSRSDIIKLSAQAALPRSGTSFEVSSVKRKLIINPFVAIVKGVG